MNMPGFDAESSLSPTVGVYRGRARFGRSGSGEVLPMLDDICGNCRSVGGHGGVGGVVGIGLRSCCRKVWKYDPITKRYAPTWECRFESCTPEAVRNPWFSF